MFDSLYFEGIDSCKRENYQEEDMNEKNRQVATFAGGCFWCTASAFQGIEGIRNLVSGYTGGSADTPTYEQVTSGATGHYEAVQLTFDPEKISYQDLLEIFFRQIDPTDPGGSFVDRGTQYRSAVFYHNDAQRNAAVKTIELINQARLFNRPVATHVLKAGKFYEAEPYHQDYHKKNPVRYKYYRAGSGRDIFIDKNKKVFQQLFNSAE